MKVMITGTSQGIGKAIAECFLINGHTIIGIDRQASSIENPLYTHYVCDVRDKEHLPEIEGVNILINNAGVTYNAPVEQTEIETFDKIMAINARVPSILTQKSLPYLRKSQSASIINITSVVAHAGYPNQSAYTASKHALLGFTKSLANEVYNDGIRVHAISPGGVYTDMIKIARPDLTGEGQIQPQDIADIVLFLLTSRTNAVIDEIIVHRVNKPPFLV